MVSKRTFLKKIAYAGAAFSLMPFEALEKSISKIENLSLPQVAQNEDFWTDIRKAYRLKPNYINLENGYFSMQSEEVLKYFIDHVREINYEASYYMRTRQFDDKIAMRQKLATMLGCSVEE